MSPSSKIECHFPIGYHFIKKKIKILKSEGQHRSCQHISEILPSILNKEEKEWFKKFGKLHYHLSDIC